MDEPFSKFFDVVRCYYSIYVPVNQAAAEKLTNLKASGDDLKTALASGFGLKWSANNQNCNQCAQGGGRCGYDPSLNSFVCYCVDGPYAFTCNNVKTGNGSHRLQLILGSIVIAVASASGVAILTLVYCCLRRKYSIF